MWPWLEDDRSRQAIEAAEGWLAGQVSDEALFDAAYLATHALQDHRNDPNLFYGCSMAVLAARRSIVWEHAIGGFIDFASAMTRLGPEEDKQRFLRALIRDVIPNPSRPPKRLLPQVFAWRDGSVRKLAQSIVEEQGFDWLPMLADALEEAGAGDAELLKHLRSPGPHFVGCWGLELILEWRPI
jgi:hypothetical protein